MTKLIFKKCKSIILILLIVPMFMLSFNSQRASAFVPAIATPVVIGEVTISTGALVALAGTTLVAGGVFLDKNANDGTACKYIAQKMVDTGNVAQYVGVSVKDSGEKVLTWTKEGLSFFQSTLTSAKSDGIPISNSPTDGTFVYPVSDFLIVTDSESVGSSWTYTKVYSYKITNDKHFNGYWYTNTLDFSCYHRDGSLAGEHSTTSYGKSDYISPVNISVSSDGGGSICVPIPSSYNNYNYAPDVLGTNVTANDGNISYRPKVGVPLTDAGTKTDKGSIVYNPTMDIPYGKTWSDIKDTVAIPTTTTDTKGTTTNTTEIDADYDIKINVDSINRIFNNQTGHLTSNTAENRKILELVANDVDNYIGSDIYDNEWYTSINRDGTQTWVEVTNGEMVNGGINEFPIYFDVQNTEDESFDAIVEAVTTTTTPSAIKPEDFESDNAIDDAIKSIKDAKKDHILKGTISGRKDTSAAHAWEVFFDGRKPSFEEIEPYIKKAFRGECEHIPFETRAGTIFKKLYKADINGNEVWVYTLPRNGKMIIEDAGVILK